MPVIPLFFNYLYLISLSLLSLYGLHALVLVALFLIHWRRNPPTPPAPTEWLSVTVQLPVFNELFVVERVIDAVCALDYPQDKLFIQVLDDSTDETTALVRRRCEHHQARGVNISLLHRSQRSGYKAGALQAALQHTSSELIAVLDADFIPPTDFLRRLVPYLAANPRLGMAQARWGHLNDGYSFVTRGQALLMDGHFLVEQTVRSRCGLLFNFNGSGGVWRKACIEEVGGWQADTLAEDLDISLRAQFMGWRLFYAPEVVIPGEIPPQLMAFKRQQYRWARGVVQILRKHGLYLLTGKLTLAQRLASFFHLTAYFTHPLMLLFLLACLPLTLFKGVGLLSLPWLSLAGLGPPLLFGISQWAAYSDWSRRLISLPMLLCLGIGMSFNNTLGLLAGFNRQLGEFTRTPKFHLQSSQDGWQNNHYALHLDASVLGELALALYAATSMCLALIHLPALAPVMGLFSLSFAYVGLTSLIQDWHLNYKPRVTSREF